MMKYGPVDRRAERRIEGVGLRREAKIRTVFSEIPARPGSARSVGVLDDDDEDHVPRASPMRRRSERALRSVLAGVFLSGRMFRPGCWVFVKCAEFTGIGARSMGPGGSATDAPVVPESTQCARRTTVDHQIDVQPPRPRRVGIGAWS